MRTRILGVLAAGLLLCGCREEAPPAETAAGTTAETSASADNRPTYDVYWFMNDRDAVIPVKEGDTPVPPDSVTQTITTERYILTFSGWDAEPVPVTADYAANNRLIFRAKYDREDRIFTVRYVADGKEYASIETTYGKTVPCPVEPPMKEGYSSVVWADEEVAVTGDCTRAALYSYYDAALLKSAYATSLLGFSSTPGANDNAGGVLGEAAAMLQLLMEVRAVPDGASTPMYAERAAAHLKNLVNTRGAAPFFSLEPYWCYATLTAAVAVAKDTPVVWAQLTAEEAAEWDFIMETFACILAFGTSDQNNYSTGPGMRGNFGKNWNPNYRLANVAPMIFITDYFGGAEAVNRILADFSYDGTIENFKKYEYDRAFVEWTKEPPTLADGTTAPSPKEFLENGGPVYLIHDGGDTADQLGIFTGKSAGTGEGVRVEYIYKKRNLDDLAGIFNELLSYCYSGGPIISQYGTFDDGSPKAYIMDGTVSPWEGQKGMQLEFKSGDGGGIRSSFTYCSHNFLMIGACMAAMDELGIYDLNTDAGEELRNMVLAGTGDTLYKGEHGYMSFSLGKQYEAKEGTGSGYPIWKSWWLKKFGDAMDALKN